MAKLFWPIFSFLSYAETRVSLIIWRFFCFWAKDLQPESFDGPCMIIAPHPDDETLGCGATIIKTRRKDRPVRIVIVTDGSASSRSAIITPEGLADIRQSEAERACKVLGVGAEDIVFLRFIDGEAENHKEEIEKYLIREIKAFSPSQIFSPYDFDKHRDHRAVAAVVNKLIQSGFIDCSIFEYPLWFWPKAALWHVLHPQRFLTLRRVNARDVIETKKSAMAEHRSQYDNLTGEPGWRKFRPFFLDRFFTPYELYFEKKTTAVGQPLDKAKKDGWVTRKSFCQTIHADFIALKVKSKGLVGILAYLIVRPGFLAVFLYRVAAIFAHKGKIGWIAAKLITRLNAFINGCEIHAKSIIGPGFLLPHPVGVVIGIPVIGSNVTILQNVTIGVRRHTQDSLDPNNYPVIGDDVTINAGAVVLGHVAIGCGAQIGANAVVTSDVPENTTAIGIPAHALPLSKEYVP